MKAIEGFVKQLYPNDATRMIREITAYKKKLVIPKIIEPDVNWYKYIVLYAVYPDSIRTRGKSPLQALIPFLDNIRNIGCTAVHILPFLESPMVDKGFDVSSYYSIRKDLGTISDLKQIVKEAKQKGMRVVMDLVFNHVSEDHEWFKKAQKGDMKYREYFIHQKTKPYFKKKFHKESAVWAEYKVNEKKRDVNVAFPEYTGEIPHWREGEDGYWYYHTYYPQQIDVNWRNPDVFIEFAKIIMYWSALGFNFRLDAIPFVGKSAYKAVDDTTSFTRTLLAAFSALVENINPESVVIVETYEQEDTIVDYFGTSNKHQAQLAYNFHLCTNIWVTLVTQDTSHIWKKLEIESQIPAHAEWINFLRNHDELSLAYLSDALLNKVKKQLLKHGASFREGYGISGRTYSFLENNEKRFINAYFLLAALPGGMLIPYGDEVGKPNIPLDKVSENERNDSRNINRGFLTKQDLTSPKGKRLTSFFKEMLAKRQILREYLNIWPKKLDAPSEVFAASYEAGISHLCIFVNLSNNVQKVTFDASEYKTVYKLYSVTLSKKTIELSPYSGIWLQK